MRSHHLASSRIGTVFYGHRIIRVDTAYTASKRPYRASMALHDCVPAHDCLAMSALHV